MSYQPKTGAKCSCKRGIERDNCPTCEGTGWVIDFKAIRAKTKSQLGELSYPVEVKWGPTGTPGYTTALPGGIKCRFLDAPNGGRWVVDEFPKDLFKPGSMERHDAEHYGVTVPTEAIKEA